MDPLVDHLGEQQRRAQPNNVPQQPLAAQNPILIAENVSVLVFCLKSLSAFIFLHLSFCKYLFPLHNLVPYPNFLDSWKSNVLFARQHLVCLGMSSHASRRILLILSLGALRTLPTLSLGVCRLCMI